MAFKIALHTTDPAASDLSTESSYAGYARHNPGVALQISRDARRKVIDVLSTLLAPILLIETAADAAAYVDVMTKTLRQLDPAWRHSDVHSAVLMTISWYIDTELASRPEERTERRAIFGWMYENEPVMAPQKSYGAGLILGELLQRSPTPFVEVTAEKLSEQAADAARQSVIAIEHNLAELDRLTRG